MARRETSEANLMILQDHLSGSELGITYRAPTTPERQSYINKRQIRKGNKLIDNTAKNRVAYGKKILTGLRESDFERTVAPGEYKPISTDPKSSDYYPEWKEWMEKHCSDVLTMLAIRVFELSVTPGGEEDETGEDLEEE